MRISKISLTVDILVFRDTINIRKILLIKRKNDPFKNCWAIPGGFVDENEDLESAAKRELFEETQLTINDLQQLKAFGTPFRDPRSHVVSVAYFGFADQNAVATAADDAIEADWFDITALPDLAFDHAAIIAYALLKIK